MESKIVDKYIECLWISRKINEPIKSKQSFVVVNSFPEATQYLINTFGKIDHFKKGGETAIVCEDEIHAVCLFEALNRNIRCNLILREFSDRKSEFLGSTEILEKTRSNVHQMLILNMLGQFDSDRDITITTGTQIDSRVWGTVVIFPSAYSYKSYFRDDLKRRIFRAMRASRKSTIHIICNREAAAALGNEYKGYPRTGEILTGVWSEIDIKWAIKNLSDDESQNYIAKFVKPGDIVKIGKGGKLIIHTKGRIQREIGCLNRTKKTGHITGLLVVHSIVNTAGNNLKLTQQIEQMSCGSSSNMTVVLFAGVLRKPALAAAFANGIGEGNNASQKGIQHPEFTWKDRNFWYSFAQCMRNTLGNTIARFLRGAKHD